MPALETDLNVLEVYGCSCPVFCSDDYFLRGRFTRGGFIVFLNAKDLNASSGTKGSLQTARNNGNAFFNR